MSHIPMPSGGGDHQTEFNSNEIAPEHPKLAPIETTTPNTGEAARAIGEGGNIDSWFYKQWRRVATVEWSTNDPIGKLLWSADVSPLALDPTLAWQMSLYHGWAGDFQIMFRVIGTGFHAGQAAVVNFPPRISLTENNNPINYSLMPYDIVDVKRLEPLAIPIRDRRNTKYHYLRKDNGDPEDSDVGGRVGIFVDTPLTTSSTGVQKISLAVWARCAPNFRPCYIRSPFVDKPKAPILVPEILTDALNYRLTNLSNSLTYANTVRRLANTTKILTYGYSNCMTMDGDLIKYATGQNLRYVIDQKTIFANIGNSTSELKYASTPQWLPSDIRAEAVVIGFPNKTPQSVTISDLQITGSGSMFINFDQPLNNDLKGKGCIILLNQYTNSSDQKTRLKTNFNNIPIIKNGECFVMFAGSSPDFPECIQTLYQSELFSNKTMKDSLANNFCYLFEVVSKFTSLAVMYVKVHKAGHMTSHGTSSILNMQWQDVKFRPLGTIHELDSFPDVEQAQANFLMHSLLARTDRKMRKSSVEKADVPSIKWQPSLDPCSETSLEEEALQENL